MKRKGVLKIIILSLIVLSLYGCKKKADNQVALGPDVQGEIELMNNQSYWGQIVNDITKTESGYYYVLNRTFKPYIMYFDEELNSSYPVCGKADCEHNNQFCNAYIGDVQAYDKTADHSVYYSTNIYFYNGNLYLLSSDGYLVRFSFDGSERTKVAKVTDTFESNTSAKLAFYGNYAYYYCSIGHLGSKTENTETIKRISLDGKKQDVVYEYKGAGSAISSLKIYGKKMYFLVSGISTEKTENGLSYSFKYNGLFSYDCETGKTEKFIDKQITSLSFDKKNNLLYYYVKAEGLYRLNLDTKEEFKIYNADETTGITDMSYDGNYIYLYNGIWASMTSTKTDIIQKKCLVINSIGTEINSIPCDNLAFMNFGDDKYLFGQTVKSEILYINKSDIETAKEWQILQ